MAVGIEVPTTIVVAMARLRSVTASYTTRKSEASCAVRGGWIVTSHEAIVDQVGPHDEAPAGPLKGGANAWSVYS